MIAVKDHMADQPGEPRVGGAKQGTAGNEAEKKLSIPLSPAAPSSRKRVDVTAVSKEKKDPVQGQSKQPSAKPHAADVASTRASSGEDLRKLTTRATDGDTIVLGPGVYSGPIVVRNKSLAVKGDPNGRSVVSGGRQSFLVETACPWTHDKTSARVGQNQLETLST